MPYITKEAVDEAIDSLVDKNCKLRDKEAVIAFMTHYFGYGKKYKNEKR